MDDQEILKLKKISGKKRRSRNSVSSSCTLVKENFELSQLLDGENTMVYALVEILKDSEQTARREKIPLSDRDLIYMMQKFMSSKRDKSHRKTLRTSVKRRLGLECGESISKLLEEHKNLATCEMANQSLAASDNLNCKSLNHSVYGRACDKDKHRKTQATQNDCKISDEENEPFDLKILYNRNKTERRELNAKRGRTGSMSRGTNTDIVQTPKVLGEVLQALNFNAGNVSEKKQKSHPKEGVGARDGGSSGQAPPHNFLLVPFIVSGKTDEKSNKTKNKSHEFLVNHEYRCFHCLRFAEYNNHYRAAIQAVRSHKCITDLRNGEEKSMQWEKFISNAPLRQKQKQKLKIFCALGNKPVSLETGTSSGMKINCAVMNDDDKSGAPIELEEGKERDSFKGECFLEEVKTLQTRLNEIIKGLQMSNSMYCQHNCGVFRKEENRCKDYRIKSGENESCISNRKYSGDEKCDRAALILPREHSPARREAPSSQDFSVQVAFPTPPLGRKVTSQPDIEKALMLDKPSQFPSEMKMGPPAKRPRPRKLSESKSTPLFRTGMEYRIKTRRTSSLLGKAIEPADHRKMGKLKVKFEGSRPDNGDMFEEELRPPEEERLRLDCPVLDSDAGNTAVLFKKNCFVTETEGENEVITTIARTGKIAKIKIIGNSALGDKCPNTGIGKIKLELDGTNTIQISNKLTRIMNGNISNSSSDSSDNTMNISNNNNSSNSNNNAKELGSNRKKNGTIKYYKKEVAPKKGSDVAKITKLKPLLNALESEPLQTAVKASKLKKPMTLVRAIPKGKESGSPKASAQKLQPSPIKTEEVPAAHSPDDVKSSDKPSPPPGNKLESVDNSESGKKVQHTSNDTPPTPCNDTASTNVQKSSCTLSKALENADQNPNKQSQAVKSIWALTKVILYKDGTQSFQVLEASSSPPGYHLNQTKKKEADDNNDDNGDGS